MSDVTVRRATTDDAAAVREVAERGWHAAYGDILDEETIERALEEWYDPDHTRDVVTREGVGYFVADVGDDVVGYVSGGPGDEETTARLGAIYVDPDEWNAGIGTELLERFEAWCRARGYERVRLRVVAENDVGASFYRSRGYERVRVEEVDLFGERVRDLTLERRLD